MIVLSSKHFGNFVRIEKLSVYVQFFTDDASNTNDKTRAPGTKPVIYNIPSLHTVHDIYPSI